MQELKAIKDYMLSWRLTWAPGDYLSKKQRKKKKEGRKVLRRTKWEDKAVRPGKELKECHTNCRLSALSHHPGNLHLHLSRSLEANGGITIPLILRIRTVLLAGRVYMPATFLVCYHSGVMPQLDD